MSDVEQDQQETKQEKMEEESDDKPVEEEEKAESSTKEEEADEKPAEVNNDNGEDKTEDVKAKDEEKKEEEDESEESEEEEEPKVGLLEQPVVLEEGRKRERKKVERMTFQSPDADREKQEIKPGKGTTLKDIPWVEFRLNRLKAEDLKPLHRILFRRVGSAAEVKKNIRKFSGFPFDKSDTEYEKRWQILKAKTFTKPMLSQVCEILDVPRSGNKEEVSERLMEYLLKPEDSGKNIPKKRKAKSKDKKKKAAKGKGKQKPKRKSKKAKDSDSDDDDEEEDEEEEEEEKESEEEDSESDKADSDDDDSDEEPPKKRKKTTKAAKKPQKKEKPKKAAPKKKATPKKKVSDDEVSDISSDSDSDDEPESKAKGPPTNDELKEVIKKMLDNANLEEVTMKSVLKDVFAKYPEHDLTDRKEFVKSTVKQIIS